MLILLREGIQRDLSFERRQYRLAGAGRAWVEQHAAKQPVFLEPRRIVGGGQRFEPHRESGIDVQALLYRNSKHLHGSVRWRGFRMVSARHMDRAMRVSLRERCGGPRNAVGLV